MILENIDVTKLYTSLYLVGLKKFKTLLNTILMSNLFNKFLLELEQI